MIEQKVSVLFLSGLLFTAASSMNKKVSARLSKIMMQAFFVQLREAEAVSDAQQCKDRLAFGEQKFSQLQVYCLPTG